MIPSFMLYLLLHLVQTVVRIYNIPVAHLSIYYGSMAMLLKLILIKWDTQKSSLLY